MGWTSLSRVMTWLYVHAFLRLDLPFRLATGQGLLLDRALLGEQPICGENCLMRCDLSLDRFKIDVADNDRVIVRID